MNKFLLTLAVCLMTSVGFAQAPSTFNFQAVARDAAGAIIPNKPVSFRISILQTTAAGTTVYQETHSAPTNKYGLVNLSIGSGVVVTGTFSTVNWGADKYFLKIDMDAAGGSAYTDMGTQQLVSVPYALNAKMAESVTNDQVDDADADSTNELQKLTKSGTNITLDKSGNTVSIADNDNDITNEIQLISVSGTNLSLNKSGGNVAINSLNHWKLNGTAVNYTAGNVGIGTASPAHKLHVSGSGDTATAYFYNSSDGGIAVKGSNRNGPTNGYLGVMSKDGMDNNALLKFPTSGTSGAEVGVLGVSTGTSAIDNIGVMGLTNGGYPGYFKNTSSNHQVSIGTNSWGLSIDTGGLYAQDNSFFGAEVDVAGTLRATSRIEHTGDNNTYLSFLPDRTSMYSGGILMMDMIEQTNPFIIMAPSGTNVGVGLGYTNNKFTINSSSTDDNNTGLVVLNAFDITGTAVGISNTATGTGAFSSSTYGLVSTSNDNRTGASRFSIGVFGNATVSSATGTSRAYAIYGQSSGNADFEYAGYFAGPAYSTVSFTTSDQKLKKNISTLNSSLDKLMLLPVKTYDFRTTEYSHMNLPEGKHTGIMAQDLENTYPELVKGASQPSLDSATQAQMIASGKTVPASAKNPVDFKAVNYTGLVPHLVKATQEQQLIIEQQKKDMEELKKQLEAQQKMLLELKAQIGLNNKG